MTKNQIQVKKLQIASQSQIKTILHQKANIESKRKKMKMMIIIVILKMIIWKKENSLY